MWDNKLIANDVSLAKSFLTVFLALALAALAFFALVSFKIFGNSSDDLSVMLISAFIL